MAMNGESYRDQLLALLPTGDAWPKELESVQAQTMAGLGEELARVDGRAEALLAEANPSSAYELLADWERVAGLPEACDDRSLSDAQRQDRLVEKFSRRGRLSQSFLIAQALLMGYAITITEYRPFRSGRSSSGDAITNYGHRFTSGTSRAGDPLYVGPWIYTFSVNAESTTRTFFRAGISRSGDPLALWGEVPLECFIDRLKPAHTLALYTYEAITDA